MIASIIQAVALFAVTNIDDIIVLALFFARGAKQRNTTRTILLGQYLGFFGILVIAAVASYGAVTLLPAEAIPYFGLIPLALGIKAAWDSIRGEDDDDTGEGKSITLPTVAAVTFANGGDNIGVYVPVFVSNSLPVVIVSCVVFLVLVTVLVLLARFIATRPGIGEWLERSDRYLFPLVLIALGVVILVKGHAFGI